MSPTSSPIRAAQRSVELKPSAATELVLAKALDRKAVWSDGDEQQEMYRKAEQAAKESVSERL